MSLEAIATQNRLESLQSNPVDGLIATYFDRAFLMFNLFVDDPRACLDLSESVFRMLDSTGDATEHGFYAQLTSLVRSLPEKNEFLAGVCPDSVLCWLLKDSADLSYAEIGALMLLERSEVQVRIADVRMALLG